VALRSDEKRRIVPRWRSPDATVEAGEFAEVSEMARVVLPNLIREHEEALEEWTARPTIGAAAELIGSAAMVGKDQDAIDAAEYVVAAAGRAGPLLTDRARAIVGSLSPAATESFDLHDNTVEPQSLLTASYSSIKQRIEPLKRRVNASPHDALAWLELGRVHATVGNEERALRAVRIATAIAGNSRFVLRSASRFYLHSGDLETAREILRRSPRTRLDPWLSAAEIATSQVAGVDPRTLKSGKEIASSGRFSDHDVSELRAAIATIFQSDGRRKDARRNLEGSLRHPTENSVAQALWLAQEDSIVGLLDSLERTLNTPRSFEARSFASQNVGDWGESLRQALLWYEDEPFSGRAAIQAALISGVALGNTGTAIKVLRSALRASRRNFYLQTNLIYNLAIDGKLAEAESMLLEISTDSLGASRRVVWLANYGLIAFRRGQVDAGRAAYIAAMKLAENAGFVELHDHARVYYLSEEVVSGNRTLLPEATKLMSENESTAIGEYRVALARLSREVDVLRRAEGS
jgi:tetratricopeptide (TPR) repeat protein